MSHNPILDELYAARAKLLADAGGDVHKYLEGVRQRERESGRLLPVRPERTNGHAQTGDEQRAAKDSTSSP